MQALARSPLQQGYQQFFQMYIWVVVAQGVSPDLAPLRMAMEQQMTVMGPECIPALVDAINLVITQRIGFIDPLASLVQHLSYLIEISGNPLPPSQVLERLIEPNPALPFSCNVTLSALRQMAAQKILLLPQMEKMAQLQQGLQALQVQLRQAMFQEQMRRRQQLVQREAEVCQEAGRLLVRSEMSRLLEKAEDEPLDRLRYRLEQQSPLHRLVALHVIARRRLPLQKELLVLLEAPDDTIRQSARLALVRLSRGTDLGPLPGEDARHRARAVERWRHWLDLQATAEREMVGQAEPPVVVATAPAKPAAAAKVDPRLEDAETAALVKELTEAKAEEQSRVLERLQSGKGVPYSDALAVAIPQLQGDLRERARQALAQRFSRMKATTLRDKMHEDDPEGRRAAAVACILKTAVENTEDLIDLLNDPEPAVVQAAHEALQKLTTVDHGPAPGATARQRRDAVRAWRDWLRQRDHPGH
jgi:hypothetical protein